jgi:preprotein translocase subunit SecD
MLKLKILVIFAVMLISIYFIIGIPRSRSEVERNLRSNIRLGADLRGGSQLTMQVHLQDAFNAEAQETATRLRGDARGGTVTVEEAISVSDANRVAIHITGASGVERVPGWKMKQVGPSEYRLTLEPEEVVRLRQEVLNQTLRVIEKKTNGCAT